jgi:predicted O-linked N-acetylglucosamine transferase (SPINDLY family)
LRQRNFAEAETLARALVAAAPRDAEGLALLGIVLLRSGRAGHAIAHLMKAVEEAPDAPEHHCNLAAALSSTGRYSEAIEQLSQAVQLRPNYPEALNNLGAALERLGRLDEAEQACRRALSLRADYVEAIHNLGNVLRRRGWPQEAVALHRRGLLLRPDDAMALECLAAACFDLGDQAGAIASYRRAIELRSASAGQQSSMNVRARVNDRARVGLHPNTTEASRRMHSSLIFAMFHDPQYSADDRVREAVRWNAQYASRGSVKFEDSGRPAADGRLRVGFVSPDFVDHPCARFALPVLEHYDRNELEVHCYSSAKTADAMTGRLRSLAAGWHDIGALSDEQAARQIRNDAVDILIDLSGHMGDNRLSILTHRPAPLQMQMCFPGTIGLDAIDYRITDAWSDPPGTAEQQHEERLLRLTVALSYDPGLTPAVAEAPSLRNGVITFACLNRPMKITLAALRVWARILNAVPNSRLCLVSGSVDGRNSYLSSMVHAAGIDSSRIQWVPRTPRNKFLELFHGVDIALDCFPYNGDATTLDGLWMGVPLITLAGDSCVARRGVGLLSAVGLSDLAAPDLDKYVATAVALATDRLRLSELRATLRHRLRQSPLGNGQAYTREFESALRLAWQRRWIEPVPCGIAKPASQNGTTPK